ncbi:lipoprotein [Rhodoferax sp.]|uniref:LPS translocon maturation chaperone LptM n=1 Tax=Rhodoferax sp. TaxID=50421 RepID=UPI0019E645C9|nr:lipoprotein [Rhodoferax sp.]
MLFNSQILVRTLALGASAVLIACGQKGPLYLPPPASVLPAPGNAPGTPQPATADSSPQHQ